MKLEEIKALAAERGIKMGKAKKADLVHAIQNSEGNSKCYQTGTAVRCGQQGCLWREDCK